MKNDELKKMAEKYDAIHNEGGEGYNPYREEMMQREYEAAAKHPRTEDAVLRDLERCDCDLARECGTYNEAKVAALHAELAAVRQAKEDAFVAAWPRDVTVARRSEWNEWVNSRGDKAWIEAPRKQARQGWWLDDLRKAIIMHGLDNREL